MLLPDPDSPRPKPVTHQHPSQSHLRCICITSPQLANTCPDIFPTVPDSVDLASAGQLRMWPRSRSASSSQDRTSVWSDYMERPAENEVVELEDLVTDDDVEGQSDQFKILNYLMGKPLSPSEEAEVLQSLQNTNAACIEDLLQIINEDSGESRSDPIEAGPKITFADDVEHIPSPSLTVVARMRLKLATLELSPDGLEVCQAMKQGARTTSLLFLAEYLPPRSCINNTPVRLSSKRICNNVITFEQEKLHSCESNKPLEFTILIKKSGCMESVFGFACFDWTKSWES
ncbi:Hypothetical predicted protein [Cloeon dipterum]|uniref:Uncharacterized protein n=1 Tax=Cloeon dipterum TaxID=197152 RepID=A0A8S1CFZ6_9INSE|nr:Hypothetical predicted protein [Cloeon dipterum]